MRPLLFLDTETSGLNPEDRIVQIAYKSSAGTVNELFNPNVPIKPEASAVTHITNKHIKDKPQFHKSDTYMDLMVKAPTHTLVAHNAAFDLKMLEKEGVVFTHFIDTLKVARHLEDDNMVNHQLQYLRYYYDLDIDLGELSPHDALADIIVLEEVFKVLGRNLMKKEDIFDKANTVARMFDISCRPSLLKYPPFGKYSKFGATPMTFKDAAVKDKPYLVWMLNTKRADPDGAEDLIYTLETYLK